ncbi:hypothetical protein AM500_17010 [Bacillus sp. FJAT-18017]|uniref:4Fe-4S dicluster domain-containing protein n=1 Tax=Bacillus sp. FJAT-18017 TaxID=1705566 RepID=UPI0006ADB315|nr:4Fe-4S dicluster domain-containing protein [Bacillus sp. FJAT-18017]ALC91306.1 hypothetical protein AM500_17010 [Bacillus sp. FJAT-18017]
MSIVGSWLESLDFQYKISEACVRKKSKRASCTNCLEACPVEGAIRLEERNPVLDSEKCKECGSCMSACPVQAVEGVFPKRYVRGKELVADNSSIPSVSELLIYHAKGLESILPAEEALNDLWQKRMDEANEILDCIGLEPYRVLEVQKLNAGEETLSRRQLFTFWGEETKKLVKDVTPANWRFNHDRLELAPYYPDYQFYEVQVDAERCTLCKTCEVLCPKHCFSIGEAGFTVTAQTCSSCGLCADSCPEKALEIRGKASIASSETLDVHQKTCTTCTKTFQTLHKEQQKCPPCTRHKQGYLSSRIC